MPARRAHTGWLGQGDDCGFGRLHGSFSYSSVLLVCSLYFTPLVQDVSSQLPVSAELPPFRDRLCPSEPQVTIKPPAMEYYFKMC